MKPLELTIYRPIGEHGWYKGDGHAIFPADKRFTDTELAAELYSMTIDRMQLQRDGYEYGQEMGRREVLYRFATHPHALGAP